MKHITQQQTNQQAQLKNAVYKISYLENSINMTNFGQISNNLKFIAQKGDYFLKIWKYKDNKLLKLKKLNYYPFSCRFATDSRYLYVGTNEILYQYSIDYKFKIVWKPKLHSNYIISICCVSEIMILTSSIDRTIVKTNVQRRQQLLKFYADNHDIYTIDYNVKLDIIASGSYDKSIKLWDGIDGTKIQQKLNAHNHYIKSLQFNLNNNQLLSVDYMDKNLKIWRIDHSTKKLQYHKIILQIGQNLSIVCQQQYILSICDKMIKIYTSEGQLIRSFHHKINQIINLNIIQPDCMKAVLIIGKSKFLQLFQKAHTFAECNLIDVLVPNS